ARQGKAITRQNEKAERETAKNELREIEHALRVYEEERFKQHQGRQYDAVKQGGKLTVVKKRMWTKDNKELEKRSYRLAL
ncbi:hypothetical protein HK097_003795, partial [Rhizophlyctis rosea]